MTDPTRSCVIVGASLAGAKAAEALREHGFDGSVVLLGEEQVRPYERPPLSKSYLRGESRFDDASVFDAGFLAARDVEVRLGSRVVAVDATGRTVVLADGATVPFDRLLLATGATPRRLSIPGADLRGVHYLREVGDADAIRAAAASGGPVVVVGAGWIGSEVAASLRQLGADVTMVDVAHVPLERVLGTEVGVVFRDLHEEHGVSLHLGVGVDRLCGGDSGVEEVLLSDGTSLPAAMVVAGVGVVPRTELAEAAGIAVDDGVVADQFLAASADGVFAAGDVANAWHPLYGRHVRLEHWSAALNQGPAAARNMLGAAVPYDRTPYFFSDQYDFGMEYRGWAPSYDEVVVRGDRAQRSFVAFWLSEGRVLAAMNANVWDRGDELEAIVRRQPVVERSLLEDEDVDLTTLLAST